MIKKSIICFISLVILVIAGPVTFAQVNQKTTSNSLKFEPVSLSAFKHCDVGNPSIPGTVKISENGFDLTAGGADIWGNKDEFNFVYVERTGDFDFVCRVQSFASANLYTKAGLMAREDLTADCRHVYFQVFSDNSLRNHNNGGYEFQYRSEKDSTMKAIYPKTSEGSPEFPVEYPNTWIRLQRINNEFTGYYSIDGKTWKPYTTFTLGLPSKIYLGLAVTAHNTYHFASVMFRNIGELKH